MKVISWITSHKAELAAGLSWIGSVLVSVSGLVPSPAGHILSLIAMILSAISGAKAASASAPAR